MGRRPNSARSNEAVLENREPAAVAQEALEERDEERKRLIFEGKKETVAIAYEFRPYYNRPKKHGLAKLILVSRNPVRGHIYRMLIARNIPVKEAQKLMTLAEPQVAAEHERRKNLVRYGF
ncbi:MAG: hypothetical protein QME32_00285 [Endomicrobiia bacterium]|nr:hypothetical protein [Endomicrobiia bacterium]